MRLSIEEIIENGKQYAQLTQSDETGRYRSWENCYAAFNRYKGKELADDNLDSLCLHLAFYLASWGMYRGSSFLLQKDHRAHGKAIRELMRLEYDSLWAIQCEEYIKTPDNIQKLHTLTQALKAIYSDIRVSANASIKRSIPLNPVSDTLITKILLGTLGCVPAYDQYFVKGIKACGISPAKYSSISILKISEFYVMNRSCFENWHSVIPSGVIKYPHMKMLDMCFWQIGINLSLRSEQLINGVASVHLA